jgi:hypothetical protein
VPVAELIRKVGISEQTFYRWKKQYVGLEADQMRQMKQLSSKTDPRIAFDLHKCEENPHHRFKPLHYQLSLGPNCSFQMSESNKEHILVVYAPLRHTKNSKTTVFCVTGDHRDQAHRKRSKQFSHS